MSSKDILRIAMELNKISLALENESFEKIEPYIKNIENILEKEIDKNEV